MRRRFAAAIVGVSAGALLLFGLPLAVAVSRSYRDEELLRVQRIATAATQAIGPHLDRADPPELPASATIALGLFDRRGRRAAGRGPAAGDGPVVAALRGDVGQSTGGGRLVVAVPVARSEQVTGAIRAERGTAVVNTRVRKAWALMGAIALGVLLLATGIAVLLARRITRPVDALAGAVRRLGDGDFTTRAPRSGVAELDAAAGALDSTAMRLGELVERERAFSANASHQLRTPLTALQLDLETGHTGRALGQVGRLQETITTLLDVARGDSARREHAPLAPLLAELEELWTGPLAAIGRPLRVVVPAALPPVAASAGSVRQILQVLLENALQHGAGTVTVTARATAGAVAVDVADEGPGVPGTVEGVFARRAGSAAGTGIGLNLARALAVADAGRLVLQQPGPGPTFTLLLPTA